MRALITGNLGYIGAEATQLFAAAGHQVHGIDAEFYKGYHLYAWEPPVDKQIRKDIRHIEAEDFDNIDVVVHLAALSNDPLGELQRDLTFDINYKASVRVAELAKAQGVSRFVMASTSSLYGVAEDKVHEESPLNPLTAYAESKMLAEQEIMQMSDETFSPTFLRPPTACGISPMLRTDIVLNNLCAWAATTGNIRIMSDGSPMRPMLHVKDIARTLLTCATAERSLVHAMVFNVGKEEDNYSIRQMAEGIQQQMPGCELSFTGEHPDSRSYFILYDRLHSTLGHLLEFKIGLSQVIEELLSGYKEHGLSLEELEGGKFARLARINQHLESGQMDNDLFWTS